MSKTNVAIIYILFISVVIGGVVLIVYGLNLGFSLSATIDENKYIFRSIKRDNIVFDLYHDVSTHSVDVEDLVIGATDNSKALIETTQEIIIRLTTLVELDQSLADLELPQELEENAGSYLEVDTQLFDEQEALLAFLNIYQTVTFNRARLDSVSNECLSTINYQGSNTKIDEALSECERRLAKVDSSAFDQLPQTRSYLSTMNRYISVQRELYQALIKGDSAQAKSINPKVESEQSATEKQAKQSETEIEQYLRNQYRGVYER